MPGRLRVPDGSGLSDGSTLPGGCGLPCSCEVEVAWEMVSRDVADLTDKMYITKENLRSIAGFSNFRYYNKYCFHSQV